MAKFSHERENPEYIKKRTIENSAEKIKRIIYDEGFKITPLVEQELDKLGENIKERIGPENSKNEILKITFEKILDEQGSLPKTLEDFYIDLIAEEIVDKVTQGENFYQVLGAEMKELKRKGIELDSKKIEERAKTIKL